MYFDKFYVFCVFSVVFLIVLNVKSANSSVINYEKMMKGEPQSTGLYDASDKVISVSQSSFKHLVIWKPYVILMEFYNSFCGHCRRFAPKYKEIAEMLYPWRHSLKVMAIDCSDDENNGLCREYEVMAYPTLRYFHLNFEGSESSMGKKVDSLDVDEIRSILAKEIIQENSTDSTWPNFTPLELGKTPVNLFEGLSKDIDHGIVIFGEEDETLATEMILEFEGFSSVVVRKVSDATIANKFKLNANSKIAAVDLTGNIDLLKPESDSYKAYKQVISRYLNREHLSATDSGESGSSTNETVLKITDEHVKEVIEEVHTQKHLVYQADLEQAIKYTIFHEIPKYNNISGETLLALQRYINVLNKYNPLGNNGRMFLKKLNEYVKTHNHSVKGVDFETQAKLFASEFSPVFESKHYVGCVASKTGLRGFTCSLWKLFHFLTVQDSENDASNDPLEILQAMHGYVKYFFGCTDCSNHFQTMATKRKIWGSTTKDNSVLWLWESHNEVNDRLKGDETEDPEFPKVQFPTKESCPNCYKEPMYLPISNKINWDKTEVIQFLKNIYHPNNISQFGLNEDDILSPKLASQRSFTGVFSNLDLTMGMLLYGFCIVMMIIAVKLFVNRGYRKKYDLYKV